MISGKLYSLLVLVALTSVFIHNPPQAQAYYDPEAQDGIPIMSARGARGSAAPTIRWQYDDHMDDESRIMAPASRATAQRRDSDLEDDDEEDEYQSGSSNHDRYENPSFGESRRFAKDGDDIESFFDKHLGPQDTIDKREDGVANGGEHSSNDDGDQYETAASSPLSTILHSLIHKKPLVITTHSADDSSATETTDSGNSKQPQHQAAAATTSSSIPIGQSLRTATGVYLSASGGSANAAPIAYLAPVAAPSSLIENPYEGSSIAIGAQASNSEEDYAPVREIYITRRPAAAALLGSNHFQSYSPSNAHWRGLEAPQRYQSQGEAVYQPDYPRHPMAASYAYQQEQHPNQADEEEQTVSYGLSFGSPSDAIEDSSSSPAGAEQQEQSDTSGVYQGQEQQPQQLAYQANQRQYIRTQASPAGSNRAYYQQINYPAQYGRAQAATQQQQYHRNQQRPLSGARYHRDPTESMQQYHASSPQYR